MQLGSNKLIYQFLILHITLCMLIFAGINRWFYFHILLKYFENEKFKDSKRTSLSVIRRRTDNIMAKRKDKKTNNTHPLNERVNSLFSGGTTSSSTWHPSCYDTYVPVKRHVHVQSFVSASTINIHLSVLV